jgi:GNAT superfamily N-acetyltransferase
LIDLPDTSAFSAPTMATTYRPATAGDQASIAALMMQVWLHTYALQGINDAIARYVLSEFAPAKVRANLASAETHCIVAEVDGHIVGVALLVIAAECPVTGETFPELDRLYVQEHFTGQGIGSSLLNLCIEHCKSLPASRLWLTVNAKNQRAVAFYERRDFAKVGTTDFILGNERHSNHVLHKRFA